MGFRLLSGEAAQVEVKRSDDYLHRMECKACPLNNRRVTINPHMQPAGSDNPIVYVLGEAPGKQEDEENLPLVGEALRIVRSHIPRKYRDRVRYNNVVRSRTPRDVMPKHTEIECCRPSVVADIAKTKPEVIIGLGNVPLNWVSGMNWIDYWRGRVMPVEIGGHVCLYYPTQSPSFLLKKKNSSGKFEQLRMLKLDIKRVFKDMESSHRAKALVHTPQQALEGVEVLTTVADIKKALRWAKTRPIIGIDYETNMLRPYSRAAKILTCGFSDGAKAYAFGLQHSDCEWTSEEMDQIVAAWVDFLATYKGVKTAHNLAFELEWTGVFFGTALIRAGRWDDSASQSTVLDERVGKIKPGCHSLEFLCRVYFGISIKGVFAANRAALSAQPVEFVCRYNALDAKYHVLLFEKQRDRIKNEGLEFPYHLALRRVPTVVLSQIKGVPVDQREVKRFRKQYTEQIEKIEAEIISLDEVRKFRRHSGHEFNPNSPPDVITMMTDVLGRDECITVEKYTGKEKKSADVNVLQKIDHPLAGKIIQLRQAYKRRGYVDPLAPDFEDTVLYDDGELHAQFNTNLAETGRLSCEGPNLQNFPKRDAEAAEVRRCIVPAPGCRIIAADYGQIEARVIAMFTKDPVFCKALWERYDVHTEWAERISRAYPSRVGGKKNFTDKKVMKSFRTDIKNQWTFPLFFGCTMQSAAGYLNIPIDVIEPLYEEFWEMFAGVKAWQERQVEFYQEHGYVECLTGRRRRGPLTNHQIFNSPVQGTAAEIVLDAMSRLSERCSDEDDVLQPEINIHDDLTFLRVPEAKVEEYTEEIITEMLKVPFDWINVPITIEVAHGDNWRDMEEIGDFSSDEWFEEAA